MDAPAGLVREPAGQPAIHDPTRGERRVRGLRDEQTRVGVRQGRSSGRAQEECTARTASHSIRPDLVYNRGTPMNNVHNYFCSPPPIAAAAEPTMLLRPARRWGLAAQLQSGTLTLGETFTFLSGLYFRGQADLRAGIRPETSSAGCRRRRASP